MKKLSYIIILTLVIITIISTIVLATDGTAEVFITDKIEIKSTNNTYKTGTSLNIILKNSQGAVEITDLPELVIQFGNGIERRIKCDTKPGQIDELLYTYDISSEDIGKLKILKIQQITEDGVLYDDLSNISLSEDIIVNSNQDDAMEWTDFDNMDYEWTDYTETDHRSPSLLLKNVNFKKENHYYYFYISNNKDNAPDLEKIGNDINYWRTISSEGKISSSYLIPYLEKNGDIYIWIAEVQNRESKIVVSAKKIQRLSQLPLTKRIIGYFSNEFASALFCYEPYSSTTRKINIKIGKMTENSILKDIKNGTKDAMSNLLNYSKTSKGLLEKTFSFGETPNIFQKLNLENRAYYYVYFELEDENGKYYPVEDIELYQAQVSGNKVNLINHTDRNFVYDIEDDENNNDSNENTIDNTTAPGKIPQTGMTVASIILIGIGFIIVLTKMYKMLKYRDIT